MPIRHNTHKNIRFAEYLMHLKNNSSEYTLWSLGSGGDGGGMMTMMVVEWASVCWASVAAVFWPSGLVNVVWILTNQYLLIKRQVRFPYFQNFLFVELCYNSQWWVLFVRISNGPYYVFSNFHRCHHSWTKGQLREGIHRSHGLNATMYNLETKQADNPHAPLYSNSWSASSEQPGVNLRNIVYKHILHFTRCTITQTPIDWLQATIALVPFQVKFSSMSESSQTLQADLCYVKRCSCVVFSLKAGRKDLTNRHESLRPPLSLCAPEWC